VAIKAKRAVARRDHCLYSSETSTVTSRENRLALKPIFVLVSLLFAGGMPTPALAAESIDEDQHSISEANHAFTSTEMLHQIALDEAYDRMVAEKEAITTPKASTSDKKTTQKQINTDSKSEPVKVKTDQVKVRARRLKEIGPMPGLSLTKEQIPGNIQSISAKEIQESHSLSLSDLMNSKLQSVNVNDYQGNPFQMDITYRGFTASPQIGTPQGLSVFFDGIRTNEPFGDIVNWDLIPMVAIESLDIYPGSNPLFGLNTLGGALAVKTKSGFTSDGFTAELLGGSFGRKQLQVSGGWNNGSIAAFGAGSFFVEDGWRTNSPSEVNQTFGKLEWQGEKASLALSTLGVKTKLVGNGTVPVELYEQDHKAVFTSPDKTENSLLQFQLSGIFDVTDTFNISGMVYNRDSNRKSSTGDIIDIDTFRELGTASRKANPGEIITCGFTDANADGFPDYYLDQIDPLTGTSPFIDDYNTNFTPNYSLLGQLNPISGLNDANPNLGLPPEATNYIQRARTAFLQNQLINDIDPLTGNTTAQLITGIESLNDPSRGPSGTDFFLATDAFGNTVQYNVVFAPSPQAATCGQSYLSGDGTILKVLDSTGHPTEERYDGALGDGTTMGKGKGYIQGAPVGVITKSAIAQTTRGGALQLNWNLEKHKLMLGASIDRSKASYLGKQRLALLDNNRNVYSDPNNIGEQFYARDHDITINDFEGTTLTKSLFFSETWSPNDKLNVAFSGRYNDTHVNNQLAPQNTVFEGLVGNVLRNRFAYNVVCPGNDLSNCPIDLSKPSITPQEYFRQLGINDPVIRERFLNQLGKKEHEKFSYYSFNPAIGTTWQATSRLNLYANWNRGTRAPSVIELGCAFDDTLVPLRDGFGRDRLDAHGNPIGYIARSLADGRGCNLPSALSGDPYLPQIVAKTMEIGARGKFKNLLEWNISAYQTKVNDDIYLVSATPQLSFFQSIGKTRREGIEFGLSGEYGKSDFSVNYSYTRAMFDTSFNMISPNNSATLSNDTGSPLYGMIGVDPGDRMPGVPLHNINIGWGYKVTPAFKIGFNVIGHGNSFVRGNENNEHTTGPGKGVITRVLEPTGQYVSKLVPTPAFKTRGTSPGYAILNFRSSYDFGKGWTATLLVNNLLDKEYFSA